jgi:hypothetical protein
MLRPYPIDRDFSYPPQGRSMLRPYPIDRDFFHSP